MKAPTKKKPGRPATGETPAKIRQAKAKAALELAGGRRITFNASPDAVQCIEAMKATHGATTDREAIELALLITVKKGKP